MGEKKLLTFEPLYSVKMGPIVISSAVLHFKQYQNFIENITNFAYPILVIHNRSHPSRQINVFKVKFVTNDPKIVGLALENWSVKK